MSIGQLLQKKKCCDPLGACCTGQPGCFETDPETCALVDGIFIGGSCEDLNNCGPCFPDNAGCGQEGCGTFLVSSQFSLLQTPQQGGEVCVFDTSATVTYHGGGPCRFSCEAANQCVPDAAGGCGFPVDTVRLFCSTIGSPQGWRASFLDHPVIASFTMSYKLPVGGACPLLGVYPFENLLFSVGIWEPDPVDVGEALVA